MSDAQAGPGFDRRGSPARVGAPDAAVEVRQRHHAPVPAHVGPHVEDGDRLVALQALLHRHEGIDAHAVVVGGREVDDAARAEPGQHDRGDRSDHHGGRRHPASPAPGRDVEPGRPARARSIPAPSPAPAGAPSANSSAVAAIRNSTPNTGLITSSSTVSANATSATGGSNAEQRAAGAERERVSREHRRPHAGEPGEHQGASGGEGATCTRACSPTRRGGVERGAQRLERGQAEPGRLGEHEHPIAIASPDDAHERREHQVAPFQRAAITAETTPAASRRTLGRCPRTRARTRWPPRRRPAPSRRRRSAAVCEATFPGYVPSFLQAHRGGEDDAVPPRAGEGEAGLGGPPSSCACRSGGSVSRLDGIDEDGELGPERGAARIKEVSSPGSGGAATNTSVVSPDAPARRCASAGPTERAEECEMPASASRKRSSVTAAGGVSAVASRSENPRRASSTPSVAATETARSNAGPCVWPSTPLGCRGTPARSRAATTRPGGSSARRCARPTASGSGAGRRPAGTGASCSTPRPSGTAAAPARRPVRTERRSRARRQVLDLRGDDQVLALVELERWRTRANGSDDVDRERPELVPPARLRQDRVRDLRGSPCRDARRRRAGPGVRARRAADPRPAGTAWAPAPRSRRRVDRDPRARARRGCRTGDGGCEPRAPPANEERGDQRKRGEPEPTTSRPESRRSARPPTSRGRRRRRRVPGPTASGALRDRDRRPRRGSPPA